MDRVKGNDLRVSCESRKPPRREEGSLTRSTNPASIISPYLTAREAITYLRMNPGPRAVEILSRYIKRGKLKPAGIRGRSYLFTMECLDEFVTSGLRG